MIVTATQIKIRSITGLIRFVPMLRKIRHQLSNVDGLVFIKFNGLRTLTGWESHDAMKAFRNNGHHLVAIKNVKYIGKTKSITWEAQSEPDWHEAKEKLRGVNF
jgi:hypothetical protein